MKKQIILSIVNLLCKLHLLSPIQVARLKYYYKFHRMPNFEHPTDLNEKINWMKFYGDTSKWADLAEYYEADADYPKGTLVKFGGDKEITIADDVVNAVISTAPALSLNSECDGLPIALVGRVPVRVIGKCHKFDYLELSEIPGVARACKENVKGSKEIIARVLEDKNTEEEGLVLCVVRFSL